MRWCPGTDANTNWLLANQAPGLEQQQRVHQDYSADYPDWAATSDNRRYDKRAHCIVSMLRRGKLNIDRVGHREVNIPLRESNADTRLGVLAEDQ